MPGGKHCIVKGCKSWSVDLKGKGVIFFSIPSDICDKWRRVIRNVDPAWVPKKGTRICSKHFGKEDIIGRKLRKGAIPTRLESNSSNHALQGIYEYVIYVYWAISGYTNFGPPPPPRPPTPIIFV